MKSLILENRYTNHQKFLLLVIALITLCFLVSALLSFPLDIKGYAFTLLFLLLFIFLIVNIFSRQGLIAKDDKLFLGVFFIKFLILKKEIDLKKISKASVLNLIKRQKYALFTSANPDLAYQFKSYDIYLLNDKHTIRRALISLKNEENSQKAINFLNNNFSLKFETYSPNFSD